MNSHGGDPNVAGPLFGFLVAALMFWLAVGFLPFTAPVAAWFQRRLESDPALPPMGRTAAAKNMSPGQIVLFSIASIFITAIIMLNVVPQIVGATNQTGASGLGAATLVFTGPAMIVAGSIIAIRAAAKRRRGLIMAGGLLAVAGLAGIASGAAVVLAAAG
ncbi:hypothetical protein [Microbacterium allomyrinae]|uniref:Uncharacterized protein n=1 Tax=Microbacterium allomyrinae TaxID=2830666 RepID=A0A9X1S0Q4_9MICO|nr:hypothetical protein [Microbacterium allomyrinae]MCC2030821.1 hypothetical protein [Microbacterium allomyrinae]